MRIDRYWPDVPDAAFAILREIAQRRQECAEVDAERNLPPIAEWRAMDVIIRSLARTNGEAPPREHLIDAAALLVRVIEARDGLPAPTMSVGEYKLLRGR
jgi:hypothetical protein